MRKVSTDEFYRYVGPLNAGPHILPGPYPYDVEWRMLDSRKLVGRSVHKGDGVSEYYLPETETPAGRGA